MLEELLTLTNRNKVIVNPLCKAIREFGMIYTEDKDEAKRIAPKELMLVALIADYRSVYSFYSDREKYDEVKKAVGLPNDWKVRPSIVSAINRYKEMQKTPTIQQLTGLRKSIQSGSNFINIINDRLESALLDEEDYNTQEESSDEPEMKKDLSNKKRANTQRVLEDLKIVSDMVDRLNKDMTTLDKLEEQVRKDQADKDEKDKGGGKRGPREMPENSLYKG